jgi:triacylglycerol lipase
MRNLGRIAAALFLAALLAGCGGGDDGSPAAPPSADQSGGGAVDISTAVALMDLCIESYQMLADFESGRTFALPAPYTLQARFDTDEHFFDEALSGPVPIAFIATSGNAIYVVFRGTVTISEWISDASLSQVDYTYVANGGKTETGFTKIYASIRAAIVQKVASLAGTGAYSTLYVTGHSLGAALATLAAPALAAQTTLPRPIVYTFAGPRAGNPLFASRYDEAVATSWRVFNTNDEVPRLPNVVTTVIGPPPEHRPELFFYEHVDAEYPITFGQPIRSVSDVLFNHSSCNYYATLCDKTDNPTQCKARAEGRGGCSF